MTPPTEPPREVDAIQPVNVRGVAVVEQIKSHNTHVVEQPNGARSLVIVIPGGRAIVINLKREAAERVAGELVGETKTDSGIIIVGG